MIPQALKFLRESNIKRHSDKRGFKQLDWCVLKKGSRPFQLIGKPFESNGWTWGVSSGGYAKSEDLDYWQPQENEFIYCMNDPFNIRVGYFMGITKKRFFKVLIGNKIKKFKDIEPFTGIKPTYYELQLNQQIIFSTYKQGE